MFSFQGTVLWINSRFQFLIIKNWNPASIRENKWWAKVDSNHRPHDYQSCALTSWAISPHFGSQSPFHTLSWWRWGGSNSWPPACKAGALPAELHPRIRGCGLSPSLPHFESSLRTFKIEQELSFSEPSGSKNLRYRTKLLAWFDSP